MQYEAFGVANIGQMRKNLQVFDKFTTSLYSAFYAENHHSAKSLFQIFAGCRIGRIFFQPRVAHPFHM